MKSKAFTFIALFILLLLLISSEEASAQHGTEEVVPHEIKANEVEPANNVDNDKYGCRHGCGCGGGGGGSGGQCKWGCCGFKYRGFCGDCCRSVEEAKAFMESQAKSETKN
ncbi:hypothetical protein Pfo_018785 [Paulownia fortunei]|nr:hypothetical protein Pfo_018785 [Paulownia fortunei]